ncbi:hypothetical protein XGA_1801, partial [Xanthomonas hortorum ATCC 19865]
TASRDGNRPRWKKRMRSGLLHSFNLPGRPQSTRLPILLYVRSVNAEWLANAVDGQHNAHAAEESQGSHWHRQA